LGGRGRGEGKRKRRMGRDIEKEYRRTDQKKRRV
jgi:hypothetical protein